MPWLPQDKTLHAANLLVCAGTLATPVTLLAAGSALVAGALSVKEISKRLNEKSRALAKRLKQELDRAIADIGHFKGEANIIVPQMIEASLPAAQTIIDTGQKPYPLLDHMLETLEGSNQPDHKLPANIYAFKKVMRPVLNHLLLDPTFTAQLSPLREQVLLEMRDMLAEVQETVEDTQKTVEDTNARVRSMQAALEDITTASRDQLEALASRFEVEAVFEKSDADLRQLLTNKATEYRALKAEVDAIPDAMKHLSNLKAAAQDAIARVDLDEVEHLMTLVHTTELEEAAKSAEIRANNALLRENVEHAFTLLRSAADSFVSIDPLEPARRRIQGSHRGFPALYMHGLRYGGTGLEKAALLIKEVLSQDLRTQDEILWAAGQNNLAVALKNQGIRTEGVKGSNLLAQAVVAYRAALEVRTHDRHPLDWAKTQNNLGLVLRHQGTRDDQAAGAELLAESVAAFRSALVVHSRTEHPEEWAQTITNLGNALKDEGIRTDPNEGAELISQAVASYRLALEVYTKEGHPVFWAGTQNHLGTALREQGRRTRGFDGEKLLLDSILAYRNAHEIRNRADHPVQWAETYENIARAHLEFANHDCCNDLRSALTSSLGAVEKALFIFNPVHLSYNHTKATRLREQILAQLNALT